jgi:cephalosporin hydroxylase
MNPFEEEVSSRITNNSKNIDLINSANVFVQTSALPKYSYNFSWLGRPIIQYPQDMVAMQELI